MKNKIIVFVIGMLIIAALYITIKRNNSISSDVQKVHQALPTSVVITEEDINEKNFTGTKSVIAGSGIFANTAQNYISERIASFKENADTDVPDMREKFGAAAQFVNYSINIEATETHGENTDSIIINEYTYTGGANGNSSYKVFTASRKTGNILSLGEIIPSEKQSAFTDFLKKALINWRPEGMEEMAVFKESVSDLTFASFDDWAFDADTLIIYFDKYEIAPGALGAVAFPLPSLKIKDFMLSSF